MIFLNYLITRMHIFMIFCVLSRAQVFHIVRDSQFIAPLGTRVENKWVEKKPSKQLRGIAYYSYLT